MTTSRLSVGQKVQLNDGRHAIIRFKGVPCFAPGEWIGVELDEASGKNDGSVQGQRYFDCEDKYGMFLRATGIKTVLAATRSPATGSAKKQANGTVTKGPRQSTVGSGAAQQHLARSGAGRQSIAPSPTPVRSAASSRLSVVKSTSASPSKLPSGVSSTRTGTSAAPAARAPSAAASARSRSSIAPSFRPAASRASAASSAVSSRPVSRQSLAPFPGVAELRRSLADHGGGTHDDHSATTQTSSTRTSDVRDTDGSAERAQSRERPEPGANNGEQQENGSAISAASDSDDESVDATPRLARHSVVRGSLSSVSSHAPSTQSQAASASDAPARTITARTGAASNREIEDLQTKLRMLEKRRLEDREKLKTLDRMRQERDRFESIIQRLQQKYQPQQQELSDLQRRLQESEARFVNVEELQANHDVELENATLDREMAEEKYETVKAELTSLREKFEENELELEVLREENQELGREISPEEKTSQGWLQLERSNERYREALIRLRDVSQEQEAELKQQVKQLERELDQFSGINEEAEALRLRIKENEALINDLKQQLDAAQSSEEMLEELSDRNMALEERIRDLTATVEDLEHLKELNDELELNHVEAEKQMLEEIDFKDSLISDAARRSQEQRQAIDDYEVTVARFRDAFQSLQTDLEDMRASKEITDNEAEDINKKSRALVDLNLKLQNSAAKTQIRTIDLDLQRLQAEEATAHLEILRSFLPDSYQSDRDSVLALLKFKRIAFKADLLRTSLRERLVEKEHDDHFAGCSALTRLIWIYAMARRLVNAITECTVERFASFGTALYELEPVERGLMSFIDGIKRGDLSLTQWDADLARSVAVMSHLSSTLFSGAINEHADELLMIMLTAQSHLECTTLAFGKVRDLVLSRIAAPMVHVNGEAQEDVKDSGPQFAPFFDRVEAILNQARTGKVVAAKAHRELEELRSRFLTLPKESSLTMFRASQSSAELIQTFAQTAGTNLLAVLDAASDGDEFAPSELASALKSAASSAFALSHPETAPLSTAYDQLASLVSDVSNLYNMTTALSSTVEFSVPEPPWTIRAEEIKTAAVSSSADRVEVSRLTESLRSRDLVLKEKEAELDEQSLRMEMLEARMRDVGSRTKRIEELESRLTQAGKKEKLLLQEVEKLGAEAKRLREERDQARAQAKSDMSTSRDAIPESGEVVLGKAGRLELERRRVQVDGLRAAVRHLASAGQTRADAEDLSWLKEPLIPARSEAAKHALIAREAKDVLLQLAKLAVSSAPLRIVDRSTSERDDRLRWRPARETAAWQVRKGREDFELWKEWSDDVARRAQIVVGAHEEKARR